MKRLSPIALACLALISSAFIGCEGSRRGDGPATVSVDCTINYNGGPVEGAIVSFVPQDHEYAASGPTDSQGRVTLTTYDEGDGAVPGSFKVTVRKVEIEETRKSDDPAAAVDTTTTSLVPEKYSRVSQTDLQADVTADGENKFEFELKD